jgi:hypothetical protein
MDEEASALRERLWNTAFLRVRELLMHDWDPIGISGEAPEDEYDRYALYLCASLFDPAFTAPEAAEYLAGVAQDQMGLSAYAERDERVAAALLALRAELLPAKS